jgi:hypothetical protein
MKKNKLWLFVLLSLTGMALATVLVMRRHRDEPSTLREAERAAEGASPAPANDPKKNQWERPAVPDNPVKREQRMKNETLLMDLATQSIASAAKAMSLTEEETSKVRQSFDEYRTGCLRIIDYPGEFPSTADPVNPGLPWNVFPQRLREILGKDRAVEFENHYKLMHFSLVKSRQAARRAAAMSDLTKQAASTATQ